MRIDKSPATPDRSDLAVLALGLGAFLTLFDVTAVVVAMPGLAKELGFAIEGAAWVIDAYSLAFTSALLMSGALADRFGRRRAMLAGNAIFLAASIACGAAPKGPLLLAARVAQGAGAAFMTTGSIALIAGAFPDHRRRARAFGFIGVISGVAMALGPTLGGLLAAWAGWRWIFYANIPFCLALAFSVPRLVAETTDSQGRPLDPLGIALLTLSLGLAIDALLRRDATWALRAACLVASVIIAIIFTLQQGRSSRPVLDPRVFATSTMAGISLLLTAIQFGYWAALVYLPLFLNVGLAISIETAGVMLLAATLPMLLVPWMGGRFVTQWGWRRFFLVAFGAVALGDLLLLFASVSNDAALRFAATLGNGASAAEFAAPFALAAFIALAATVVALVLLPAKDGQGGA
ncbi:MFS transporter [Terrarubrum flagellatum]|uniref:MFS transporter n=1 Tax=Terrirubrum flagellatum TaxID=2895980 RepID=UPI003145656E